MIYHFIPKAYQQKKKKNKGDVTDIKKLCAKELTLIPNAIFSWYIYRKNIKRMNAYHINLLLNFINSRITIAFHV